MTIFFPGSVFVYPKMIGLNVAKMTVCVPVTPETPHLQSDLALKRISELRSSIILPQ